MNKDAQIRFFSIMLVSLLLVSVVSAISIYDWDDLNATRDNLAGSHTLENDLNSSTAGFSNYQTGVGFVPIGTTASPFSGGFYGQNFTIDSLFINKTTPKTGLFGKVYSGGIFDLGLTNVNISGGTETGALIGEIYGSISSSNIDNVYATGTLQGTSNVGGLVGYAYYKVNIDNSYSEVTVVASSSNSGGLVGNFGGGVNSINQSYATGNVTGASINVGGLVGYLYNDNAVDNSYATGVVNGYTNVGGLVGYLYGSTGAGAIDNSYATGDVISANEAGGLVGAMYAYNGNVDIDNSYATGNVEATGNGAGGLVGLIQSYYYYARVDNSYATGNVTSPTNDGGLVGVLDNNYNVYYSVVDNSYWNNQSGNPNVCLGFDQGTDDCTAIQDNESYFWNYSNAPMNVWDFTNIWDDVKEGVGYPVFQWQNFVFPSTITTLTIDYSDFLPSGLPPEDVCYKLSNETLTCLNNTVVLDYSDFTVGQVYPDNICFKLLGGFNLCFNKNGVINE